jgi:hypothetical protein
MPRSLPVVLLLALVQPARAGHDQEVALAGVLQRAHDLGDPAWLRRMLTPEEDRRFDREGLLYELGQRLSALGLTRLVTCHGRGETYDCLLTCQHGSYTVRVQMSAPDPLVRPDPRPGRILKLQIGPPALDPDPLLPRRRPWPALIALAGLLPAGLLLRRRRPLLVRRPPAGGAHQPPWT